MKDKRKILFVFALLGCLIIFGEPIEVLQPKMGNGWLQGTAMAGMFTFVAYLCTCTDREVRRSGLGVASGILLIAAINLVIYAVAMPCENTNAEWQNAVDRVSGFPE